MPYRQGVVTIVLVAIYIFIAFLGSIFQNKPIYGDQLGFLTHNNYDWKGIFNDPNKVNQNNQDEVHMFYRCKNGAFKDWGDIHDAQIPVKWSHNAITLVVIFGTLFFSHFFITFISNWKAEKRSKDDGGNTSTKTRSRAQSVNQMRDQINRDTLCQVLDESQLLTEVSSEDRKSL
eukprot:403367756